MNAKIAKRVQERMQRFSQYPMSTEQRSEMYHTVVAQETERYEAQLRDRNPYSTGLPEQWTAELAGYNPDFSEDNSTALFRGRKLG